MLAFFQILVSDFNPRSPHGERHDGTDKRLMDELISIHAPRTGSDGKVCADSARYGYFNPRSPHGERRSVNFGRSDGKDFNPRSPHGERQNSQWSIQRYGHFNPRSPHGERL